MPAQLELLRREHLEFVRGLRNSLRQHFFDSKPITKAQQTDWYNRYLRTQGYYFYVIRHEGHLVGTVSFKQLTDLIFEIGNLMLLPAYRGKGIMHDALCQIRTMAPLSFYIAHVKPTNTASLNLFKRAGFWRVPNA